MARSRSRRRGRDARRIARRSPAPRFDDFDDVWLDRLRERPDVGFVDLESRQDRRRYHPNALRGRSVSGVPPRGLTRQPRIVIVPEGHKLARHQTYGGRYTLDQVRNRYLIKSKKRKRHSVTYEARRDRYGMITYERSRIPQRVGFTLPWQVIICVRRKRRREVLHALNIAGRSGVGRGKRQHRNEYSEVRC